MKEVAWEKWERYRLIHTVLCFGKPNMCFQGGCKATRPPSTWPMKRSCLIPKFRLSCSLMPSMETGQALASSSPVAHGLLLASRQQLVVGWSPACLPQKCMQKYVLFFLTAGIAGSISLLPLSPSPKCFFLLEKRRESFRPWSFPFKFNVLSWFLCQ